MELNEAGSGLMKWLRERYDLTDCEPLAAELCHLADRLTEVRALMAAAERPLDVTRLISCEVSLQGQFLRAWKALGLSDDEEKPPVDVSAAARRAAMTRWGRRRNG